MNEPDLLYMFETHRGRQIDKWLHYFPIYERHFARFRHKPVRMLEIGVDHGGSLQLWKRYFGRDAEIIGVDINPACKDYAEPQITIVMADQRSPTLAQLGPFDIVLDDGSHEPEHQEVTFANLWPRCTGVYLIEDCHKRFPYLVSAGPLHYQYPWVMVQERPAREIRGTPSRELRPDEQEARKLFGKA